MSLYKNRNYKPMLLSEIKEPFDSKDYIYEMKFDGHRALVFVSPTSIYIQSRNGKDITSKYPELESIKSIVNENTIFDGEIVLFHKGKPDFSKLQSRSHLKSSSKIRKKVIDEPVVFVCFDIIYYRKEITNKTLLERKKILSKFKDNDVFMKTFYIEEKGISFFKKIKKKELEGIVAKKKDSKYYINTRTDDWIKIKNIQMDDFYIGGYSKNEGSNVFSIYLGEYINKDLVYVGKVFVSLKNSLYNRLEKLETKKSPFINNKEVFIYVKPVLKCEIEYLERRESSLRHAVFRTLKE